MDNFTGTSAGTPRSRTARRVGLGAELRVAVELRNLCRYIRSAGAILHWSAGIICLQVALFRRRTSLRPVLRVDWREGTCVGSFASRLAARDAVTTRFAGRSLGSSVVDFLAFLCLDPYG